MGIRIQPLEIEIPADDPFKYDLLDRRESITALTHIIGSIDGPCVLAVDAPWGAGKTTFLKIWEQHLRNENFPVVSFNAWETDFSDDPFIALSDAILQELNKYDGGSLESKINEYGKLAAKVAQVAAPAVIKAFTSGLVDITPLLDKGIRQTLASNSPERMADYREAQELLKALSNTLQDVARDLAESKGGLPLVIVIDELDRCRPSYAVELLEAAKHIFAADHVVFVLAVNRSELAHSVSALYGSEFDAIGYLNRFFDIDFRLPEFTRRQFINSTLDATQVKDHLNNLPNRHSYLDLLPVQELLNTFFDVPELSLRTIGQAIHRLGLVLASTRTHDPLFTQVVVIALIVRTMDPLLYQRFIKGDIVDSEVADSIFDRTQYVNVHWRYKSFVEAVIIVAAGQFTEGFSIYGSDTKSPLFERYENLVKEPRQQGRTQNEIDHHAARVVDTANLLADAGTARAFTEAVQRLELLSAENIVEGAPQI